MNKTRVAVILPGLGRVQRGAETAFLEVARGLNTFPDIEVVLFGSHTEVPDDLQINAVECTPREKFENWPKVPALRSECHYEELSYVGRLWRSRIFKIRHFDATLSCTYPWVNWFLRFQKRKNRNCKNIFVTQNGDWMCRAGHREYRFFRADGLVTINPDYYENNKDRHETRLIPNGTDPEYFYPKGESGKPSPEFQLEVPEGKKVVLMASAMIDSKRVVEGLRSAALVEDAHFVVVGDGPLRDEVRSLAEELMPGRFQLVGSVQREQMPSIFRQADCFLHMSKIEPFGIVYLEAAATGLPVVTHDWDTPRWILGDTALYCDSDNYPSVADAIRQALDPAIGRELGIAARKRVVEDWTWKAQAAKYRDFIHDLTGKNQNAGQTISSKGQADAIDNHRQLQHS